MARSHHRALAAVAGVSATVLMCLVIYSGGVGRTALRSKGLSGTTAALQKDIARQHNIGSEVKAWVAASAMKGVATQLKPQRLQQLFEDDSFGIPLTMDASVAARPAPVRRAARATYKLSAATEVKDIAEDTIKDVASNSEHEAALEASVKQQGQMIKDLESMMEKMQAAPTKRLPKADAKAVARKEAAEAAVKEQGKKIKKLQAMVKKMQTAPKKAAPRKAAPTAAPRTAVPTLGSWDMAKAAGEGFGTNVVHLYGDLSTKGRGVEINNPYSSGIKQAETRKGEQDFSGAKEEDTDYWNEDEPDSLDAAADTVDAKHRADYAAQGVRTHKMAKSANPFDEAADQEDKLDTSSADSVDAESDADDVNDTKPPLTSWDMAKFANNVEAGGGTMGTNIAYMYDSLSNKGQYRKVEGSSPLDNDNYDEDFDEYKPKKGARGQVLKQRFGNKAHQHHIGAHGKKFAQGRV